MELWKGVEELQPGEEASVVWTLEGCPELERQTQTSVFGDVSLKSNVPIPNVNYRPRGQIYISFLAIR